MIYTIGHSNLNMDDFLTLVEPVEIIVDIRSHPGSKWPQFHTENLRRWLPRTGKQYLLDVRLGGWRADHLPLADRFRSYLVDLEEYAQHKFPKQRIGKTLNPPIDRLQQSGQTWTNQGLWDYQFFMMLDEFRDGVQALSELAQHAAIGIMCAEALWWRCHRSMVSDYLVFIGQDATHLQPKLTSHSKVIGDRLVRYHKDVLEQWRQWRL